jgi:nucleoid-associated protein YgaU|tara:strand:- start:61 stop:402 length:342 start_codon:yes stop_codon:yes gene_type:complete
MPSRYKNTKKKLNDSNLYRRLRQIRGVTGGLLQYETDRKRQPDIDEVGQLNNVMHIWTTGDRLSKLAEKYYGDPTMWWVIAWYNGKPTEGHLSVGDTIYIPTPLERVYGLLGM